MNKKRLMIVGAAKFTVPIIELAKQRGFETIVVSLAGNYPGFLIADRSYQVDVRDKETILEIAKKERINGVLTDQTDLPVPAVAYVAEKLGLPGIGYECALRITDKFKCREHCKKLGFPIPSFFKATRFEEAREAASEIGFPLVVKPTDSMGARGISKVSDFDELPEKFENAVSCSASRIVILEKYFHGKKIAVTSFSSDFRLTNLIIEEHEHFDLSDLFIIRQGMTPCSLSENLKQKILDFHTRLFETFEVRFGIGCSELKVDEITGEFCLMEPSIRGQGGFVSSHIVPLACGVDVLSLLIELASGRKESVSIDRNQLQDRSAGNVYFYLPPGVISRVDGIEEIKSLPGVHRAELNDLVVGRRIEPLINSNGRQGPVVYAGEDRMACEEIIKKIREILTIEIETNNGLKGPVWT